MAPAKKQASAGAAERQGGMPMGNQRASRRKSASAQKGGDPAGQDKGRGPPFSRRAGAYAADWFFGELFAAFPIVMCYSLLNDTKELNSRLQDLPGTYAILAGILSLFLSVFYFAVIPWRLMPGKTIGKRLFHLRIVGTGGADAGLGQLLLRQLLWLLLLEGSVLGANRYFWTLLSVVTGWEWLVTYPQYVGFVIGCISVIAALLTPQRRALHDYAAGTRVVLDP